MALLLKHQTVEEFVSRFRAAYRDAERERCVQLCKFIISRINAGDITAVQVRAAFGLNSSQWTTLRNKMQSYIDAHSTVQSAIGE